MCKIFEPGQPPTRINLWNHPFIPKKLSVHASRINFTFLMADFFNWQQNFIALLCSFFKSIFESSNLRGVTKTIFTKIIVTQQWKVITSWNFDHRRRIDYRSHSAAWLCVAMGSFAIRSELRYSWTTFVTANIIVSVCECEHWYEL